MRRCERWYLDVLECVGFTSASGLGVRMHGVNLARLDPKGAGPWELLSVPSGIPRSAGPREACSVSPSSGAALSRRRSRGGPSLSPSGS